MSTDHSQRPLSLATENPKCYTRVAAEIFSTKGAQKSPADIWSSLHEICEEYGLEAKWALSAVVDFFIQADGEDVPFFLDLFRKHNEIFARHGETRDNVHMETWLSCDDDETAAKQLVSPVSGEIRIRYGVLSREICDGEARSTTVQRFCRAVAILVRGNIVQLSDISETEFSRIPLEAFRTWFVDLTSRKVRELAEVNPPAYGKFPDVCYIPEVVLRRNGIISSCPLTIELLAVLFDEGAAQHATAYLVDHEGIIFYYHPRITVPFLTYMSSEFDRSTTIGKFQILRLVASVLGPWTNWVEGGFRFFQKVCILCKDKLATHASSVAVTVTEYIFPTLSMYEGNHDIARDVWEVLKNIEIKHRIMLYRRWRDESYPKMLELQFMEAKIKKHVGFLLRKLKWNLSNPAVDSVGKSIALIAMTNRTIVWRELSVQMSTYATYEMLAPALVKAVVSNSGPFLQDVMFWTLVDMLEKETCGHHRLGPANDTVTSRAPRNWLGTLMRSLLTTTFKFQGSYLTTFLESLDGRALTHTAGLDMFSELLISFCGVKGIKDVSEKHIMTLGGSTVLKQEVLCPTTVSMLQRVSTDADCVSLKKLPESLHSLIDAFRCESLGRRILLNLAAARLVNDTSRLVDDLAFCHGDDRRNLVIQHLLRILRLGEIDLWDIVPDISTLLDRDVPLSVAMEIGRLSLRPQIESRSLGFIESLSSLLPSPQGINQTAFVLFWSLECYDVRVPDCEYDREISRLMKLKNSIKRSSMGAAALSRQLKSLEKSHDVHTVHVSWMLSRIPIIGISKACNDVDAILNEMVVPRAIRSIVDAHYVFCFLCQTVIDPLPLLNALFDYRTLLKSFTTFTESETCAFSQLLYEILADVSLWSSYRDLDDPFKMKSRVQIETRDEMESLIDTEIESSAQDDTRDDYSVRTDIISDSENASDTCTIRCDGSDIVDDAAETFVARKDAEIQDGCVDDDRDSSRTSQSEAPTFVDAEADPTYSLFRHGVEPEAQTRHWEENIFNAMSAALVSRDKYVVANLQQAAIRLTKSVPQRQKLWRSLLERHLGPLGEEKITSVAENPEKFLGMFARV